MRLPHPAQAANVMPTILIKVPQDAFPLEARKRLLHLVSDAAANTEHMPPDPTKRALTWVVIDEVEPGMLSCAGVDMTSQLLPCIALVYVPQGVLDAPSRALYVQRVHAAFAQVKPLTDKRRLVTSVMLHDVVDGTWGASGDIWTLPEFAKAAGYGHLQHLVPEARA